MAGRLEAAVSPPEEVEVAFAGELDIAEEEAMANALYAAAAAACQPPHLVLVMSAVTFMDSTAVRVVLHARRDTRERGGDLVLRGVTPKHRRLLEVMGLEDLIDD
jgi:anti-anti-sigma factor